MNKINTLYGWYRKLVLDEAQKEGFKNWYSKFIDKGNDPTDEWYRWYAIYLSRAILFDEQLPPEEQRDELKKLYQSYKSLSVGSKKLIAEKTAASMAFKDGLLKQLTEKPNPDGSRTIYTPHVISQFILTVLDEAAEIALETTKNPPTYMKIPAARGLILVEDLAVFYKQLTGVTPRQSKRTFFKSLVVLGLEAIDHPTKDPRKLIQIYYDRSKSLKR